VLAKARATASKKRLISPPREVCFYSKQKGYFLPFLRNFEQKADIYKSLKNIT